MRTVIQRVKKASVEIDGNIFNSINAGLLIFVGIEENETEEDLSWLSTKIANLRVFNDADGVPNISVKDTDGEMLVISQFTLHASTKKGNRPSYIRAAKPDTAIPVYEKFIQVLESAFGKKIKTGVFGADMKVELINDGPLTLIIDTKNKE